MRSFWAIAEVCTTKIATCRAGNLKKQNGRLFLFDFRVAESWFRFIDDFDVVQKVGGDYADVLKGHSTISSEDCDL